MHIKNLSLLRHHSYIVTYTTSETERLLQQYYNAGLFLDNNYAVVREVNGNRISTSLYFMGKLIAQSPAEFCTETIIKFLLSRRTMCVWLLSIVMTHVRKE